MASGSKFVSCGGRDFDGVLVAMDTNSPLNLFLINLLLISTLPPLQDAKDNKEDEREKGRLYKSQT